MDHLQRSATRPSHDNNNNNNNNNNANNYSNINNSSNQNSNNNDINHNTNDNAINNNAINNNTPQFSRAPPPLTPTHSPPLALSAARRTLGPPFPTIVDIPPDDVLPPPPTDRRSDDRVYAILTHTPPGAKLIPLSDNTGLDPPTLTPLTQVTLDDDDDTVHGMAQTTVPTLSGSSRGWIAIFSMGYALIAPVYQRSWRSECRRGVYSTLRDRRTAPSQICWKLAVNLWTILLSPHHGAEARYIGQHHLTLQ